MVTFLLQFRPTTVTFHLIVVWQIEIIFIVVVVFIALMRIVAPGAEL